MKKVSKAKVARKKRAQAKRAKKVEAPQQPQVVDLIIYDLPPDLANTLMALFTEKYKVAGMINGVNTI